MKSERGNVVVYLLVGLVLFGLLLSGAWWVKNQSSRATAPVASTDKTQPQTETKVSQDDKPAKTDNKPAENQPKPTPAPTPASPAPSNPAPAPVPTPAPSVAPTRPESQTPRIGTTGPSSVASSGPLEDAITSSLLIGGVTFATASYLRSRRTA